MLLSLLLQCKKFHLGELRYPVCISNILQGKPIPPFMYIPDIGRSKRNYGTKIADKNLTFAYLIFKEALSCALCSTIRMPWSLHNESQI